MECSKIERRVRLPLQPSEPRGFEPLCVRRWLGNGAESLQAGTDRSASSTKYKLYGVVQHLGASPFSGHYVATCWHQASRAWWEFNDSRVSPIATERLETEVMTSGAYVLFLDRENNAATHHRLSL